MEDMVYTARSKAAETRKVLLDLVKERAVEEGKRARAQSEADSFRLARVAYERSGMEWREVWTEGDAFDAIYASLVLPFSLSLFVVIDFKTDFEKKKETYCKRERRDRKAEKGRLETQIMYTHFLLVFIERTTLQKLRKKKKKR